MEILVTVIGLNEKNEQRMEEKGRSIKCDFGRKLLMSYHVSHF